MGKNDLRSLILSIIINIILILLIPGMRLPTKEEGKISVGLVEYKDEDKKVSPKKSDEEKMDTASKEATETPEKVKEEKVVEIKEVAKETEKPKKKPLPEIAPMPEIEVLHSTKNLARTTPKESKKIQDVKKEIVFEDSKELEKYELESAKLEKAELEKIESTFMNSEIEDENLLSDSVSSSNDGEGFVALSSETDKMEGFPKGYKDIGSSDGSITGRWDESNKMPVYPSSAELAGKTGTVMLQVNVDSDGRVRSIDIQGSGIPELNRAIEEVAMTWKIYLSKNGQKVYGDVTLEIPFRLLRGE